MIIYDDQDEESCQELSRKVVSAHLEKAKEAISNETFMIIRESFLHKKSKDKALSCFHACQNSFIRVLTKALGSHADYDTRHKINVEARFLADKMVELGQEAFARHIRTVCNGGGMTEIKANENVTPDPGTDPRLPGYFAEFKEG